MNVTLTNVTLPDWGQEVSLPPLSAEIYRARVHQTTQQMLREKLDFLVVYADGEHHANLAYLTGFDPRFEEALLILDARGQQRLLLGNECMSYQPDAALQAELKRLYPRCLERMIARRQFVRDVLGVQLHDSVLPISDIPAWLPPYALNLDSVFVRSSR